MTTKVKRQIVKIDEDLCNGCGACVPACAEGAIEIIDGKAKLVSEIYCDGLGACLGECPQDAIKIEEREAEEFDEKAVEHHLHGLAESRDELPCGCPSSTVTQFDRVEMPAGCPSARVTQLHEQEAAGVAPEDAGYQPSMLRHWPVQLTLVPPRAPFLQGADVVLTADCVPFAYAGFHRDFLRNHALLVACPKLDDFQAHQSKLNDIMRESGLRSLTVVHMEVPCCSGLVHMAMQAVQASGKDIPFKEITVGVRGDILS